jgi:hypothetical protein
MKDNIGPQVASSLRGFEAAAALWSVPEEPSGAKLW